MENLTICFLGGLLVVREWQNWKDRRELLDRIMCVDYRECKKNPAVKTKRSHVNMTDQYDRSI